MAVRSRSTALVVLLAAACGEPEPSRDRPAIPVATLAPIEPAVLAPADAWTFDGGIVVDGVRVQPVPLSPGTEVEVSLSIAGVRGDVTAIVSLAPPRPASRQVALGGVDAPPPSVPLDPRTRVHTLLGIADGTLTATLELPRPWHPRRAVVMLELIGPYGRIAARQGPRTEAGVALLALPAAAPAPTEITAARAESPIAIDARLDEPVWSHEPTILVASQDGEPWDGPDSRVWMAWTDDDLLVAAEIADADVWATLTERDDPLWNEEVFELFVFGQAPARRYLELQISPRGTIFDARFSSHRKGEPAFSSAWRAAVAVDGTLDDRSDRDRGLRVEAAVPWAEICAHTDAPCPIAAGSRLRVNAFRFERPAEGPAVGLSLSPTRVPDFHAADNAAILVLAP